MFANLKNEPIEDGGELNESQKHGGEFVVAGGNTAMAFDSAKEVFEAVSATLVATVKGMAPSAPELGPDADANACLISVESVGIEATIRHHARAHQCGQQRLHRLNVVSWTGGQTKPERATLRINHHRNKP